MCEKKDFLLEIGVEEMPSAPLNAAVAQLKPLLCSQLDAAGLTYDSCEVHSTPRRLAVLVWGLATSTKEVHEVKRGPAVSVAFDAQGNPTRAALGFAKKNGCEVSELKRRREADGREYICAEKHIASKSSLPLLSEISRNTILSLQWPNYRSQRWAYEHESFVRPIRWICALFGQEVVPFTYADVSSSNLTFGHRVLGPGAHAVDTPSSYVELLRAAGVLFEDERKERILAGIKEIEDARPGSTVDTPKAVLAEVINLCEYPSCLVGSFDEEFLKVPQEIICESMLKHQRYFPIFDAEGSLTREFVIVSNTAAQNAERVINGNERVVRPRLDDAKFFYEEDLKQPLETYVSRLASVTFQEKLGTMLQKAERMEKLAGASAKYSFKLSEPEVEDAARAAYLAKGDLVTQAVVEFTSQQGVMGGYYALASGESSAVAQAITEHYRPRFAGDEVPSTAVGAAVAVADKLDTICGMFAIGDPPTGSSDPFAVRRSAIGVLSIFRAYKGSGLKDLIRTALIEAYRDQGLLFDVAHVKADVIGYFSGRLAAMAKDEGFSPDTIAAISALKVIDPTDFFARVSALESARKDLPELYDDLAVAYSRAAHLTDASLGTDVETELLGSAEKDLLTACDLGQRQVESSLAAQDYEAALAACAALREPIDTFFEEVLVMDPDQTIRNNRLKLLNRFVAIFDKIADFETFGRKK